MSNELPPQTDDLIASVLRLPVADRMTVANALLISIEDVGEDTGLAEAGNCWDDEIAKRLAEINSKAVKPIPSAEMWQKIGGKPDARN